MSHNHGGMSMGSMALPALPEFPKFYYAVVGSAVAVATLANIYNHILYRQRLSAARAGTVSPAKPKSWFPLWNATLYALTREASNFSVRVPLKGKFLRLPTVGRTSLVLANVIVLLVLCFYGLNLTDQFQKENVGFRCGAVTIGQLPLIFLLSGKNNVIGYLSGISYERLNWLHRWAARCMLFTATIHMGYFLSVWAPYDYFPIQLKQSPLVWRGLAAWCVLVWINISSSTPIRAWNYELFVVQHVASFAVFTGFVYIHAPPELQGYTLQEQTRDIKLELTVYVTCDESFTEEHRSLLSTMTAPKSTAPPSKALEHGTVELRSRSTESKVESKDSKNEIKEITTSSSNEEADACGPDGKCCCRTTIDEASSSSPAQCCCCTPANVSSRTSTSSAQQRSKRTLLVHPSIQIFSGRPQTKDIIRRSLEQALGESAVVVCGPQGLRM
ncbi:hypothetical protein E8E11_006599 [Didymella keratinophila]|nr:hypothetical protein E8E11_006599 [Didymella keratinophila]